MDFGEFILAHEGEDPVRLLLSRERWPEVDVDLAVTTLEVRRRLRTKVPQWYAVPSLVYPSRLSGEQCSSAETARYKAAVLLHLEDIPSERKVADLTGGLGVDAWAFASVASEVLYNEMQPELADAARHNFKELGVNRIAVQSKKVEPGHVAEVLGGFRPDVIFLDPARRADDGRKVFLLEDCRPDVIGLLPELLDAARYVLLKLSPMADITMVTERLGHVREVHIVASEGECKELLLLIDRNHTCNYTLTAYEAGRTLTWHPSEEAEAMPVLPASADLPRSLFVPGKSLTKGGAFNLPCVRAGLVKLGRHTHLYTADQIPEEWAALGKVFTIEEVLPLGNRTMKAVGKRFPRAEVTARNIPLTSDLLRKKTGCASGGDVHIFGVRLDFAGGGSSNQLLITRKI